MKLLFICNIGQNRSKTAAELFSKNYETKYFGIYAEGSKKAKELLDWADVVFVMEEHQRKFIADNYPKQYITKRILNLEIIDSYRYNQPELIKILKERVNDWLKKIK
jgi:predicted protein tyrosine phosphatase